MQIHAGREFPDELPTRVAFQIYYFPVNEAETPGLRVFCCYRQPSILCFGAGYHILKVQYEHLLLDMYHF